MNSWALSTILIPTTSSYGTATPSITSADQRAAPEIDMRSLFGAASSCTCVIDNRDA